MLSSTCMFILLYTSFNSDGGIWSGIIRDNIGFGDVFSFITGFWSNAFKADYCLSILAWNLFLN